MTANPAALDDRTIAGNFILISHIAYGDLTGLHMWIFKLLSDHRSALDPVRAGEPDASTRIVMETLRLEQSEFLYRRVIRTFEYEGMRFPAGWMIRCCINESHRDPAVFPEPDRFDPERFARRAYSREEYAPFGADAHGCMDRTSPSSWAASSSSSWLWVSTGRSRRTALRRGPETVIATTGAPARRNA